MIEEIPWLQVVHNLVSIQTLLRSAGPESPDSEWNVELMSWNSFRHLLSALP